MKSYNDFMRKFINYVSDTPYTEIDNSTTVYPEDDDVRHTTIELSTGATVEVWTTWPGKHSDAIDEIEVSNVDGESYDPERAESLDDFEKFMVTQVGIISTDAQQEMDDVEFVDYDQMDRDYRAAVGF